MSARGRRGNAIRNSSKTGSLDTLTGVRIADDPAAAPGCAVSCAKATTADELNEACFCVGVDAVEVSHRLRATLRAHGLPAALTDAHVNLFAGLPVYVAATELQRMARVVAAVEQVFGCASYRAAALSWAPASAHAPRASPGGLLGFDFHLTESGPKLIEINTNPGGVLLCALLGDAQRDCFPGSVHATGAAATVEEELMRIVGEEWRAGRGTHVLRSVVIVDDDPESQYLYPEFVLLRELFRRHGLAAEISDPSELVRRDGRLWLGDLAVDFVYNRLTDFSLDEPSHGALRDAYLDDDVLVSPHPRAHALCADKRNLTLLGDAAFLASCGLPQATVDLLASAIPLTRLVAPDNRNALWASRGGLFFKPAAGFGSKASYRGNKLTRRVWDEIARGVYVAQDIVAPSRRADPTGTEPFKVDVRCFAYSGKPVLLVARMYRGQTTNFRTAGGGFAPVVALHSGGGNPPDISPALARAENEGWHPA